MVTFFVRFMYPGMHSMPEGNNASIIVIKDEQQILNNFIDVVASGKNLEYQIVNIKPVFFVNL